MAGSKMNSSWHFGKNILERNGYLLDQELGTDVLFQVSMSGGQAVAIKAHRYMLMGASPVYWSMFSGDVTHTAEIVVSDVQPEAFKHMLRYIYTEKEIFTGDAVMHVLHAAKKYQLSDLAERCIAFVHKQINATNVCTVLEHSRFFNEAEIASHCLDIINLNTEDVFSSESFLQISQQTVKTVLHSNNLTIKETDIFKRCIDWAKRQYKNSHHSDQCSGEDLRKMLGDALFNIRFPTMTAQELADIVCVENVLSDEEQVKVFRYLNTAQKSESALNMAFSTTRRICKTCIDVGDRVRVKRAVTTPMYNWGNVTRGDTGVVKSIHGDKIYVDFPNNREWQGHTPEMELVHSRSGERQLLHKSQTL